MSNETESGREPIELIEFVLPRCINVYGSSPCTASGSGDGKCFNTRATCQDVDNYRDTPDRHLTATNLYTQGDTVTSADYTKSTDFFAAFEVRFPASPVGIIFELGGSTTGCYLGVTAEQLVWRAGNGGAAPASNIGYISVDALQYAGKTVWIYVAVDWATTREINMWIFDPVELTLTHSGSDTFTVSDWSGSGDGAIGEVNGTAPTGADVTNWTGAISTAKLYDATAAPTDMSNNFRQRTWLSRGQLGEPTEEQYLLPCLTDAGTIGTKINLSGAEKSYEPLGRRATLDFTAADYPHSDIVQDPYYTDRETSGASSSTFWRKWLERQKFGKTGALIRRHIGYVGQRISEYETSSYVLDAVQLDENGAGFHCRDVLSKTEFRQAQIPAPSAGVLDADITDVDTSFDITGDVEADYPAAGTVRINDEIFTYTGRTFAATVTTFTGLLRGSDGSTAADHDADDLVQLCRRYTSETITNVLTEWFTVDSHIPAQLVDLAKIANEDTLYLNAYTITTLLTEPTGVSALLGQLSEECSFYIWWNERTQQIDMQAIRAVGGEDFAAQWTYEDNIVGGSFSMIERPDQRLNVVTFYYNLKDFAGSLDKATNYKNGLKVLNGTTSLPEQYGNVLQTRKVFSIFLSTEAQANQTSSRLAIRYADAPRFCEFLVDAKDRSVWVGDYITISHNLLVNALGRRRIKRWLVIEAEEIEPGSLVKYVCADITLDGVTYYITENGIGSYTVDLFDTGNAFITDASGLNPDGSVGATVS